MSSPLHAHAGLNRPFLRIIALCVCPIGAFYLPGVAPREYNIGDKVEMKVNTLNSVKTQLPYGYYTLPYCKPENFKLRVQNLGEILAGDGIKNSPYDLQMQVNETCKLLCKEDLTDANKELFRRRIDRDYNVNWIVDNLPAHTKYVRSDGEKEEFVFLNGFPVGLLQDGRYYVHNHVRLILKYHSNPSDYKGYRIVGFDVEPRSMKQSIRNEGNGANSATCVYTGAQKDQFDVDSHSSIWYTYDVVWVESDIRWASRWDNYLKMEGGDIHWLSILNSGAVVLFLSGLVALILLRTLRRDIVKYNELATEEEMQEETGWKLVHADVFRRPKHPMFLTACIGSGTQLLCMSVVTLVFAAMGFLSPAHRGGLLQSSLLLFTFMGMPGGYVSARFYKLWEGEGWKAATLMTALLFPGTVFGIFFFLNLLIWGEASAGAVPFSTLFALVVLWFGISVPLVFFGSYMGYKKDAMEIPTRISQLKREIPQQLWYMKPLPSAALGGILPFGAVFTELFFIMSSIWQHQIYYMFGFLVLVMWILIITCAEVSIALIYFQLTAEDHRWWWRSFATSGFSGVYVFLYAALYFCTKLQMDKAVSVMLYFGYMGIFSLVFGLVTGTIGMLSCFVFVKVIYGSIKVD